VYSYIRINQIRKTEKARFDALSQKSAPTTGSVSLRKDDRWERILQHIHSENENDWRQAIIAADSILEEIVTKAGYVGESLGEKMRGIEKSDFTTIDEAWHAHKVRNRIAHDGSNFHLNKREALETIELYKKVFEEFFYL
jgi:ATPase subunit of ABC transporter with duplicated ATPase domains